MGSLVPRLIAAGLGAAVSPVAIMVLISLMLRKHAVRNALLFLLGFTPILLALGLSAVYILHVGGSGKKTALDGYIDIALGVLCLAAIALVMWKKPKEKASETGEISAPRAVLIGCLTMLTNYSTLIIYISGIHFISAARLEFYENILAVVLLTLVTLSTLIVPIVIYVAFPAKAEKALSSLRVWLAKHNKEIGAAILLIFGVLLLAKGIKTLF